MVPASSFPFHFLLSRQQMVYPFGQFRSAVLSVSSPKVLPIPSLLVKGNVGGMVLLLCQHCSAATKAQVCYQCLWRYPHTTQHCEGCYGIINSISARPNAPYLLLYAPPWTARGQSVPSQSSPWSLCSGTSFPSFFSDLDVCFTFFSLLSHSYCAAIFTLLKYIITEAPLASLVAQLWAMLGRSRSCLTLPLYDLGAASNVFSQKPAPADSPDSKTLL